MEKKNIPNHQPAIVYNFKFSTSRWLIQKMVGPSHEQSPHEIRCLCQVLGPKCEPKPRRNFLRDSGTSMFYPAWFLRLHHVYLERSTICWVNQRTFDWAIFNSYVTNYQRDPEGNSHYIPYKSPINYQGVLEKPFQLRRYDQHRFSGPIDFPVTCSRFVTEDGWPLQDVQQVPSRT